MIYEYVEENRSGDHVCYISNLTKAQAHYPGWTITQDLRAIMYDIYNGWIQRSTL
jgi:CDP-paratose 2-epimerase